MNRIAHPLLNSKEKVASRGRLLVIYAPKRIEKNARIFILIYNPFLV
jgi:hypothetical protein